MIWIFHVINVEKSRLIRGSKERHARLIVEILIQYFKHHSTALLICLPHQLDIWADASICFTRPTVLTTIRLGKQTKMIGKKE